MLSLHVILQVCRIFEYFVWGDGATQPLPFISMDFEQVVMQYIGVPEVLEADGAERYGNSRPMHILYMYLDAVSVLDHCVAVRTLVGLAGTVVHVVVLLYPFYNFCKKIHFY